MPNETLLYDNDFIAYCDEYAKNYADYIRDLFPAFPNINDDARECLEAIGMEEDEVDAFLKKTSAIEDDEAYELLTDKIGEVMEENQSQRRFSDEVFSMLTCDETGFYRDIFDRDNREFFNSGCDMIGIDPSEDCLAMGTNIGWRRLSGFAILEPKEDDIAQALRNTSGANEVRLKITHEEGKPYLSAVMAHHDAPTGEFYTLVPASWARKAFESKELHDDLNQLLMASDDVRDFLYENCAVPELEQDPVAYGLMKATVNHSNPPVGMSERIVRKTANQLAQFRLDAFDAYCRKQGACCTPKQPYDDPYSTAETLQGYMEEYLCTIKEGKETALSRGLEKLLMEEDGSKAIPKLKGYLKSNRRVIAELKRLGREKAR